MSGTLHIISNLLSDHTVLLMCLNNGQKIFNYVSLKLLIEIRSSMKEVLTKTYFRQQKNLFTTMQCKEDGFYYKILVNILMGGKLCPPAKLLYRLYSPNLSTTTAIYFDKNDHNRSFGSFQI